MAKEPQGYNLDGATEYHYGQFPPTALHYERLIRPLVGATEALARYDALLRNLRNKELLLAPLRSKEAVVSSRIEGTVATLEEVLKIEAAVDDEDPSARNEEARQEALEVYSYTRAMRYAQRAIEGGLPIGGHLLRDMHAQLLFSGRGADKSPGKFKTDQNYVVDQLRRKILFVPIDAQRLEAGIGDLEAFMRRDDVDALIQTALAHLEFEALHPFKDGNGRVGRMLIALNLWSKGKIAGPHFYISEYLELHREEYIERLRLASAEMQWTEWVEFFLEAVEAQANQNIELSMKIIGLYDEMKEIFREVLASQWAMRTVDYVFEKPVFRNNAFTRSSGIPEQTAHRITGKLADAELLTTIEPAAGRRPALYAFMPLLDVVR